MLSSSALGTLKTPFLTFMDYWAERSYYLLVMKQWLLSTMTDVRHCHSASAYFPELLIAFSNSSCLHFSQQKRVKPFLESNEAEISIHWLGTDLLKAFRDCEISSGKVTIRSWTLLISSWPLYKVVGKFPYLRKCKLELKTSCKKKSSLRKKNADIFRML